MKKNITLSRIDKILRRAKNLEVQEANATTYEDVRLTEREAIYTEIRILEFHLSRIAMEGEDLDTINDYDTVMNYIKEQAEEDKFHSCKMLLTSLKLISGLDVTFFTTLPSLRETIMERGPITLEDLSTRIEKKKSKTKNNGNTNRR